MSWSVSYIGTPAKIVAALDCHSGIRPGRHSIDWQLLPELEYRGFADLDLPARHSHTDPQSSRTAGR